LIGNGGAMRACKTGNLKFEVTLLDGRKFVVTLNNVKYVPEICSNLFSLNNALKNDFKLSKGNVIVILMKKYVNLTFDCVIKTLDDGCVTGVMMRTISAKQAYGGFAHASIEKEKRFDINHLHRVFGHCGMETLKNTVKMYGLRLVRSVLSLKHNRRTLTRVGQAQVMFQASDSTLILAPLRNVVLEEPSSGPLLLINALVIAGVLF